MYNIKRQQGGTILGLIIGLIIGLGIALAVAIVITKTPMPFTDKSGRVKASDLTAGQTADPNKPLYGKGPAREPAKEQVAREAPPENTAAPQTSDKPQFVKVDPKLDQQESKAPVIERSTAAETTRKPDLPAVDDKWSYYLQAGAFRESTDAENIRAKLALIGVEAKISERQTDNGVLYRVRVGPFSELESMNKVRGKLSDNGVDAAVVRIVK